MTHCSTWLWYSDHGIFIGPCIVITDSTSLVIKELFIHEVKIFLWPLPPLLEPSVLRRWLMTSMLPPLSHAPVITVGGREFVEQAPVWRTPTLHPPLVGIFGKRWFPLLRKEWIARLCEAWLSSCAAIIKVSVPLLSPWSITSSSIKLTTMFTTTRAAKEW